MKYCNINQIVECGDYPFTLGQMRFFLLHRHKNGLTNAVRPIDKRLYIKMDLFDEWIESQKDNAEIEV